MNVLVLLFLFAVSKITELTELDNFVLNALEGLHGGELQSLFWVKHRIILQCLRHM